MTIAGENAVTLGEVPGLVGVSANGTDVYFSSYDTLVPEDHNGSFLKFYDARTDGGFPQENPNQPCAAAEECHGPGTESPQLPVRGTGATLSDGNETHTGLKGSRHRHKAKHKRHKAGKRGPHATRHTTHRHDHSHATRGGGG